MGWQASVWGGKMSAKSAKMKNIEKDGTIVGVARKSDEDEI